MSRHDKAWLRNRYKRVYAMPNPLRCNPISEKEYDALFPNRKNVLACGRLLPIKGFDKLIIAFGKVADRFPEWDMDICGEDAASGCYSSVLKKLVKDLGLEERIHFIGFHSDVAKIMREHSIFCLTSLHEGFPNVLAEAMANGMACLSFDIITGPSEIIVDGIDGVIVEDQNENELSEGLLRLMSNENERYSLGRHAIDNIQRFSSERIVDKWEKLLFTIINEFHHLKV